MSTTTFDLVGVGAGPFNLSVAALAKGIGGLSTLFLEQRSHYAWHPGLLLPQARMQTHYLKDLVSTIDPTSPYSFVNYLVKKRKIHGFLATGRQMISRLEFSDYLAWVAADLDNLQLGEQVDTVDWAGDSFVITTARRTFNARHICIGTGVSPTIPAWARLGACCFHASTLALRELDLTGMRVAVIGGGQSGADIFLHGLQGQWGRAAHLYWVSRRANFEPLDEACFSDHYFTPGYVSQFHGLPEAVKGPELARQKLTSDGITSECLAEIYQLLYQDAFVEHGPRRWSLLPGRAVTAMSKGEEGTSLTLQHNLTGASGQLAVDLVILATGFAPQLPDCLAPLLPRIELDKAGRPRLDRNYGIYWDGPVGHRLFAVNGGRSSHGIADPQLSLAAWRAATILNQVAGYPRYDVRDEMAIINWGCGETGYQPDLEWRGQ